MLKLLGALLVALVFVPAAHARVHNVVSYQILQLPGAAPLDDFPAHAVAIDGDFLVVIVDREGGRQAVLYRRGSDGQWAYSRVLLQSSAPADQLRAGLAMKNGLAAIDLAGVTTIWERNGNDWSQARTDGEIRLPGGHAISARSILIGSTGCSTDGVIYEKSTDGVWRIAGRLPARAGVCGNQERDVELNYNFALVNDPAGSVHAWARNGTNLDWRTAGDFELSGTSTDVGGALALQNSVAVAPGSTVYRRTAGTSWIRSGSVIPINHAMGDGDAARVVYRDSVLVTAENRGASYSGPYAYVLDANGNFKQVAVFQSLGDVLDLDFSGNTLVTANDNGLWSSVTAYDMYSPRVPPDGIYNDFNARDVSGFETSAGSAYAIAGNRYDYIYRQSNADGETRAVLTDSNWRHFQEATLRMRPTALNGADAGAGVALRYVDENNYLALLIDADSARLESRRNGVTTVLTDYVLAPISGWRSIRFTISDDLVGVFVDGTEVFWAWDRGLMAEQGRVALITRRARADFDNLRATPTSGMQLLSKLYAGYDDGRPPLNTTGGVWVEPTTVTPMSGLQQTSTTGSLAVALSRGPAIDDQAVAIRASLNAWGTSGVPWFGVVARYQDAANHYEFTVRSTNQVQIRKVVNGISTVLDAASYTAPVGQQGTYQLQVQGNQLHGFVNGQLVLMAIDDDLKEGRYGVATFRAAATFHQVGASQY